MLGAIVRGKLFGALRMEIPPHFIHGFASGIARRTKDPSTLRATGYLSILFFDPYQFAGRASHDVSRLSLLQLRVLRLGFLQDGDVGVGVFPEGEEVLVGGASFQSVAREGISAS
jgi:hypothetical protein